MTSYLKPSYQCCKAADKAMVVLRMLNKNLKDIVVDEFGILFMMNNLLDNKEHPTGHAGPKAEH